MKTLAIFGASLLLAVSWIVVSAVGVSAQSAPLEIYQRYLDAVEHGDVPAIVSLFADDAVFVGGGGCRPTPCVGKMAIQKAYENQRTERYRLNVVDRRVEGATVTWRAELQNDATHAAGVERIITTGTMEVRGDRIGALRGAPDPSDAQTATFVAWQMRLVALGASAQAQPAPSPSALPRTGEIETPRHDPLMTAAIGLLLLGLGAFAFCRRDAA